jgi:predicted nuclease of predicted toxin-antitoxin system
VKFFLDHDVNDAVAGALRRHGHEAIVLRQRLPPTAPDDVVFAEAQNAACIMITCNRNDYLALASAREHRGLIILIRRASAQAECNHLLRLIESAGEAGLTANINFA